MKMMITIVCFILSVNVLCNDQAFEVKMNLNLNGKLVISPQFKVLENKNASISYDDDLYVKVIVLNEDKRNNTVKLIAEVGDNKSILSKPQFIVNLNEEATMTISNNTDSSNKEIKLSVIVNKI